MLLNDVLRTAYKLNLVAEFNAENTLSRPWADDDWNCGIEENCGQDKTIRFDSNSRLRLSNAQLTGANASVVMTGGFSVTTSLPPAFEGANVSISYAPLSILNIDTLDALRYRRYKGRSVTVFAGGLLNRGRPNELNMDYTEYVPWIEGVFVGDDKTDDSIDLSIGLKSAELNAPFPPRTFDSGVAEGQPKPFVYGIGIGVPVDVGDGVAQFHDGTVDLENDSPSDLNRDFPAISVGEGSDYWHELRMGNAIPGAPGGTTTQGNNIGWSINDNKAESFDGPGFKLIGSKGLNIVAGSNNDLALSLENYNVSTYENLDFRWAEVQNYSGSQTLVRNTKGVDISVELSGGVLFDFARHFYFKFSTSSSGTVKISAPSGHRFKNVRLVIRSIAVSVQTIDAWSTDPDSVVPPFTNTNENHAVSFNDINESQISFDYTCSNIGEKVAFWFEHVELYKVETHQITVNMTDASGDINLSFRTANESQKVLKSSPVYSSPPPNVVGENSFIIDGSTRSFTVEFEIGHGECLFRVDSIRHQLSFSGVTYEDNVIKITPDFSGGRVGVFAELPSVDQTPGSRTDYLIKFKARITASQDVTSVLATAHGLQGQYELFEVTEALQEFEYRVASGPFGSTAKRFLEISTWQGSFAPKGSGSVSNPSQYFVLEIPELRVTPLTNTSADIMMFAETSEERLYLPTYQVANAFKYKGRLPQNLALFDKLGMCVTSPNYTRKIGRFKGSKADINSVEALKDISRQATGTDYVDTSIVGERVGFMIKERKPWIDHIADICNGADYFYKEKLVGSGIEVNARYDYLSFPDSGTISEDLMVKDSFKEVGQPSRMSKIIVEYQIDELDSSRTLRVESGLGDPTRLQPTIVKSPFFERESNERLARLIVRQSVYAQKFEGELHGFGYEIDVGQAWFINNSDVPSNRPCVIDEVTEQVDEAGQSSRTMIKFTVLNGDSIHG